MRKSGTRERYPQQRISLRKCVDRNAGGAYIRVLQRLGGPFRRLSGWFRDLSSLLLPAERRGRRIFGRLDRAKARDVTIWSSSRVSRADRPEVDLVFRG